MSEAGVKNNAQVPVLNPDCPAINLEIDKMKRIKCKLCDRQFNYQHTLIKHLSEEHEPEEIDNFFKKGDWQNETTMRRVQ